MSRFSIVRVSILGVALLLITSQLGTFWAQSDVSCAPVPPEVADGYRTLEMLTMNIGSEGGLSVNVVSVQNASHYQYDYAKKAEAAINSQLQEEVGYVAMLTVEAFSQFTALTGEILGPALIIDAIVRPVYVVPSGAGDPYVTSLNWSMALALARHTYDESLGDVCVWPSTSEPLVFTTLENDTFNIDEVPVPVSYLEYRFVDVMVSSFGNYACVTSLLDRLATMGGFMSVVNSTGWPIDHTACGLVVKRIDKASPKLMNGIGIYPGHIAVRDEAVPGHDDDCDSMIVGRASSYLNRYLDWEDVSIWSLLDYLGYEGPLLNKMYEDPSACSLSIIGATGPNGMTVQGVPEEWLRLDDMPAYPFEIPLEKDGGVIMPGTEDYDVLMRIINQFSSVSPETNYTVGGRGKVKWFDDAWGPSFDWSWGEGNAGTHMIRDILIHPQGHLFDKASPLLSLAVFGTFDQGDGVYWINPDGELGPALFEALLRSIDSYGFIPLLESGPWGEDFNASIASKGFGFIDSLSTEYGITPPAITAWDLQEAKKFLSENWDEVVQVFASDLIASLSAQSARIDGSLFVRGPEEIWLLLNQTVTDGFEVRPELMNALDDFCAVNLNTTYNEIAKEYDKATPLLFQSESIGVSFDLDVEPSLEVSFNYLKITKTCSLGRETKEVYSGNTLWYNITVTNLGLETAYDVRVIDGASPLLKEYDKSSPLLWKVASLGPGQSWSVEYETIASRRLNPDHVGMYAEKRAICLWFNESVEGVSPDARSWYRDDYSMSEPGAPITVLESNPVIDWFTASTMGVPHFVYLTAGVAALVVVVLLVRRRLT